MAQLWTKNFKSPQITCARCKKQSNNTNILKCTVIIRNLSVYFGKIVHW